MRFALASPSKHGVQDSEIGFIPARMLVVMRAEPTVIDFESLDSIFRPRSIAVIGASNQPGSVGHAVYANLKAAGFAGRIVPINQKHDVVQGDVAWRSLNDLIHVPDLVVVCTPAATVSAIARCCGERNVGGMIVISAGFRESGEAGRRLEAELRAVLDDYPRLRLIGPNCLGVLAPHRRLNASFSTTLPRAGNLAVISQSGALCTAILDWSLERDVGFSGLVSVGNMVDVSMGDLIDYFAADEQTSAIVMYLESLTDPRHFMAAARACTRSKPIIALKAGRFAESSQAALSHTGAIAGVDAVYDAAFRRAGIERVFSFDDLFDCAKLLQGQGGSVGPRLAIVTNAGGPGIMASDAWLAQRGQLAHLSSSTVEALNQVLPPQWSHGNPVDVLGDAHADRYAAALRIVSADPGVDSVLAILTPQSMTDPVAIASAVTAVPMPPEKRLLTVWMGGPSVRRGRQILDAAHIPVYTTPEQAVNALAHLVSAGRLREQSAPLSLLPAATWSANGDEELQSTHSSAAERDTKWRSILAQTSGLLGEVAAKQLLADYQIPVVPTAIATSALQAGEFAVQCGFPVVLKIISPDISHKTDVGGVELNLADVPAVISAYDRILAAVARKQPEARIDGVTVQPMIAASRGIELLLGATCDKIFGPVVMVGSGGVTAEIQRDAAMQLPPLSERRIAAMLRDLRIAPILEGYRGRPGANLPKLTATILAFSQLVEDRPELQAIEINPLLVTADAVIALDARVIVGPHREWAASRYSHLAVCPYPGARIRSVTLANGVPIRLRPIRLDDEARWQQWLREYPSTWPQLRRFPARACSLDYDSEMMFVAEDAQQKWLGLVLIQRQLRGVPETVTINVPESPDTSDLRSILSTTAAEFLREWDANTRL